MIVVADTSPLNYLVKIEEINLLPELFREVLIPGAVLQELQHERVSLKVREWSQHLPRWVGIRTLDPATPLDHKLMLLGPGEREAIQLALQLGIGSLIMDEFLGRDEAQRRHLKVNGTLGILEQAARLGHINFRMSSAVREAFLNRNP